MTTHEQILKKAVEKANANGYKLTFNDCFPDVVPKVTADYDSARLVQSIVRIDHAPRTIFSHDFAKAFWGEERNVCAKCKGQESLVIGTGFMCKTCNKILGINDIIYVKGWVHHLQMMVIQKDPIKYLEKFI